MLHHFDRKDILENIIDYLMRPCYVCSLGNARPWMYHTSPAWLLWLIRKEAITCFMFQAWSLVGRCVWQQLCLDPPTSRSAVVTVLKVTFILKFCSEIILITDAFLIWLIVIHQRTGKLSTKHQTIPTCLTCFVLIIIQNTHSIKCCRSTSYSFIFSVK